MALVAWRVCKVAYAPLDGTGALLRGGRWHSAGRPVVYAADSYAGAILEILAHVLRPRTLPGAHHAARLEIPDELVAVIDSAALPSGWDARGSPEARQLGDEWLTAGRSAVLVVPSIPARPIGRTVCIDPAHPDAVRITVGDPFPVPWDDRLF